MHKTKCFKCGGVHKLRTDKFPNREITTTIQKRVKVIGYICLKCSRKHAVKDRTKGLGWRQALKDMFNYWLDYYSKN